MKKLFYIVAFVLGFTTVNFGQNLNIIWDLYCNDGEPIGYQPSYSDLVEDCCWQRIDGKVVRIKPCPELVICQDSITYCVQTKRVHSGIENSKTRFNYSWDVNLITANGISVPVTLPAGTNWGTQMIRWRDAIIAALTAYNIPYCEVKRAWHGWKSPPNVHPALIDDYELCWNFGEAFGQYIDIAFCEQDVKYQIIKTEIISTTAPPRFAQAGDILITDAGDGCVTNEIICLDKGDEWPKCGSVCGSPMNDSNDAACDYQLRFVCEISPEVLDDDGAVITAAAIVTSDVNILYEICGSEISESAYTIDENDDQLAHTLGQGNYYGSCDDLNPLEVIPECPPEAKFDFVCIDYTYGILDNSLWAGSGNHLQNGDENGIDLIHEDGTVTSLPKLAAPYFTKFKTELEAELPDCKVVYVCANHTSPRGCNAGHVANLAQYPAYDSPTAPGDVQNNLGYPPTSELWATGWLIECGGCVSPIVKAVIRESNDATKVGAYKDIINHVKTEKFKSFTNCDGTFWKDCEDVDIPTPFGDCCAEPCGSGGSEIDLPTTLCQDECFDSAIRLTRGRPNPSAIVTYGPYTMPFSTFITTWNENEGKHYVTNQNGTGDGTGSVEAHWICPAKYGDVILFDGKDISALVISPNPYAEDLGCETRDALLVKQCEPFQVDFPTTDCTTGIAQWTSGKWSMWIGTPANDPTVTHCIIIDNGTPVCATITNDGNKASMITALTAAFINQGLGVAIMDLSPRGSQIEIQVGVPCGTSDVDFTIEGVVSDLQTKQGVFVKEECEDTEVLATKECNSDRMLELAELSYQKLCQIEKNTRPDPCDKTIIPDDETITGAYDCTISNERVDTVITYSCDNGNIIADKQPQDPVTEQSCINVPDVNEPSNSTTNPNLNPNWNVGYYTSACPMYGDFEMCYTMDYTRASTLSVVNVGPPGSFWGIFGTYNYNYQLNALDRDWKRPRHQNTWPTGWIDLTNTDECRVCIRRVGDTVTYLYDGVVVHTATLSSTAPVYLNITLYANGANVWSTGVHDLFDFTFCPLNGNRSATAEQAVLPSGSQRAAEPIQINRKSFKQITDKEAMDDFRNVLQLTEEEIAAIVDVMDITTDFTDTKPTISTELIDRILDDLRKPNANSTIRGKYKIYELKNFADFYRIAYSEDITEPKLVKTLMDWIKKLDK